MKKLRIYLIIAKVVTWSWMLIAIINFNLLTIHNYFVTKLILIIFFVLFVDVYLKEIIWLINKIRKLAFAWWPTLDGLPTSQIFDLLISENWLPAKKFTQYISSDKNVYKRIWDNLERVGILIRWNKNARILNNQYTANQIFNILNSKQDSSLLPHGLIQVSENSYSFINHRIEA